MPAINKAAVTGGVTKSEWYPDNAARKEIRERVAATSTANVNFLKLTQTLPPRCRIIAAELRHATAMSIGGNAGTNGTATRYALIRATSDAALTSIASDATASNSFIITGSTNTASASLIRSIFITNVAATTLVNTTTSEEGLYLIPVSTGAQTVRINSGTAATSTASTSYVFSGTGQYDVLVYLEQFGALE